MQSRRVWWSMSPHPRRREFFSALRGISVSMSRRCPGPETPVFYRTLVADSGNISALVLRLLILTATRSAEARGLMLDEIDGAVWTIPPHRTKSNRPHRVALSTEALRVIAEAEPLARNGLLFASRGGGAGPVLDAALSRYMRDRAMKPARMGFEPPLGRGVPRWPASSARSPRRALGTSPTGRAYRRTDYLEKRLVLMARWSDFLTGAGGGEVVALPLHAGQWALQTRTATDASRS